MMSLPENWLLFDDSEKMARAVVNRILTSAQEAIEARGHFNLVTAGGSTPSRCYQLLREQNADWQNWYIFMGDERVYPANHRERNSFALYQSWLNFDLIPSKNIFYMPTEQGLDASAKAYINVIKNVDFDLTLLGAGEDGHTASLFPGHNYPSGLTVVKETNSPKPPKERISLSFEAISESREVIKLISGSAKKSMVGEWLKGQIFPITRAEGKQTYVYLTEDVL